MRRGASRFAILAVVLTAACSSAAQAPPILTTDPQAMRQLRDDVRSGSLNGPASARLRADAERALKLAPLSVTDKVATPPSGDKHDYLSLAPYWWPNPATPSGLPYIRRDGERNPEIERLPDHKHFDQLMSAAYTLGLAYYLFGDERYADHAARLLRAWFLDPATRMNPHLQFAQGIRGINDGRGIGLIETRGIGKVVDAVGFLAGFRGWTPAEQAGIEDWFERFLAWMRDSANGRDEAAAKNNHGTYYDVQVTVLALALGKREVARDVLRSARGKRIDIQIEPDGRQPLEIARTRSFSYSVMNLTGLFELARLGDAAGIDLWHYRSADGRSLRAALDYLLPFATGEKKWEGRQIQPMNPSSLVPLLLEAAVRYDAPGYRAAALKLDPDAGHLLAAVLIDRRGAGEVAFTDLDRDIREFFDREMAAHVAGIGALDPPPGRVLGALTTGEFSWGTFMRALAAYAELSRRTTLAGHDLAATVGKIGVVEARSGGKAFSQMYAALALQHFGTDLSRNAVWQSLSADQRQAWHSLLDPARFYDREKRQLIDLAENYLGVAARVATVGYAAGIGTDRAYVDEILERAAAPFANGTLYADDAPPTARYDRYSQEYARYIYQAAETAGRNDIMKALEPSLKAQMRLWWDLLAADGYGYPWGRSLGEISYMDTMEIAAFLAAHPQFRPAPLPQLLAAYYAAWQWLRRDFQPDRHLLATFAYGRGHYSYISREREWQQTTSFFGKALGSHLILTRALAREPVERFPAQPRLPEVARFEFFRRGPRPAGVWIVRSRTLQFALPITTGQKSGAADYLPAPHGLPGFRAPVEVEYPALVPFVEFDDGSRYVAGDAADGIEPASDGKSLTVTYIRWAKVGEKASTLADIGLRGHTRWSLDGNALHRQDTLTASKPLAIRRWWLAVPSSFASVTTSYDGGARKDTFEDAAASFQFQISVAPARPLASRFFAPGDGALGRGSQGPIPAHLHVEMTDLQLTPDAPLTISYELRMMTSGAPTARAGR